MELPAALNNSARIPRVIPEQAPNFSGEGQYLGSFQTQKSAEVDRDRRLRILASYRVGCAERQANNYQAAPTLGEWL